MSHHKHMEIEFGLSMTKMVAEQFFRPLSKVQFDKHVSKSFWISQLCNIVIVLTMKYVVQVG